jgi:hypothetical protein
LAYAAASVLVACGDDGARGPEGPAGDPGPSIPIIQTLSASGVPAARGGRVEVTCDAQSPGGSALTYAWTLSSGWTIESGAGTASLVLIAPATYGSSGSARVTVTDGSGRTASGVVSLRTVNNSAPIVHTLNVSPHPMERGASFSASVSASDPNEDTLGYQWNLPAGFTLLSGQGQATITARADRFASGDLTVAVSDGTATTTASDYLRTRDGKWTLMRVAQASTGNRLLDVAMDGNGRTVVLTAVYESASQDGVRSHVFEPGWGWHASWSAGSISPNTRARLVMDAEGNALSAQLTPASNLEVRRFEPASDWPVQLFTVQGGYSAPTIAVNAAGDAVTAMLFNTYPTVSRLADGTWEIPHVIGPYGNTVPAITPKLVIDDARNAMMLIGRDGNLWVNRYVHGPGAIWGPDAVLLETGADPVTHADIAMDAAGNAIAVWTQGTLGLQRVWANRFVANAGWSGPVELMPDVQGGPVRIVANRDGVAMAAWTSLTYGTDVMTRRFTPAGGWEDPVRVDVSSGATDAFAPAIDEVGTSFVAWLQRPTGLSPDSVLWVRRFDVAEGWGEAQSLDYFTSPPDDPDDLAIAANASGNAVVLWGKYHSDGGSFPNSRTVWAGVFE